MNTFFVAPSLWLTQKLLSCWSTAQRNPFNGSQLYNQISFAIGVRFYPSRDQQHYVDLDLDHFSWLYRLRSTSLDPS